MLLWYPYKKKYIWQKKEFLNLVSVTDYDSGQYSTTGEILLKII